MYPARLIISFGADLRSVQEELIILSWVNQFSFVDPVALNRIYAFSIPLL